MGVVTTVRQLGVKAGSVLDVEDRRVLGQLIYWALGVFLAAALIGASIGILVRAAEFAAGGW